MTPNQNIKPQWAAPFGKESSHCPVVVKPELERYYLMAGDSENMEPEHKEVEPSRKLKP